MKNKIIIIFLFILFIQNALHSQWYQQSIPVSNLITGLEFVDSLKGWASTSSNLDTSYILHTTNGGANWNIQYRITGADFEVLDAIDSSVIYAGGYRYSGPPWSVLLKTTNGGINWINMNMTVSTGFDDMFFVNRDSGYMCENTFLDLFRTTNGGVNWERKVDGLNQSNLNKLFFATYNIGYCGATSLFKTTNAGDNWFRSVDFSSSQISSIFFINEMTGWIGRGQNKIYKTTNAGINWILQNVPFFGIDIFNLKFINENIGWGGTSIFYIYKTTSGGLIWGYQEDSLGSKEISVIDSLKGWTGDFGISHTLNGGGTITKINSYINIIPTEFALFQNYPNPFNATTKISFDIKASSIVKLKIYDISGREINKWESNGVLQRGRHEFLFDAGGMSSGVYFYKIEVSGQMGEEVYSESRKMMLVK